MTRVVNIAQSGGNNVTMRNKIINGNMMIDQRNAGASVTPLDTYTLDRWRGYASAASKYTVQQNAGSITPPSGYVNYLGATSSSAYSVGASDYFAIVQNIEGLNVADLGWGTASAQTVTISFWVRSSLTGTFGGSFINSGYTRCYPFTYTISAANTWEQKTVTIAGDTTGTWLTTNGVGIRVWFGLGAGSSQSGTAGSWQGAGYVSATGATSVVGTNGATFYITGVQLEAGTTATPFEQRLYGTELALCQRYFYMAASGAILSTAYVCNAYNWGTLQIQGTVPFPVNMRANPTLYTSSGTNYYADDLPVVRTFNGLTIYAPTTTMASVYSAISAGTGGVATAIRLNNASAYVGFNAEL